MNNFQTVSKLGSIWSLPRIGPGAIMCPLRRPPGPLNAVPLTHGFRGCACFRTQLAVAGVFAEGVAAF